MYRGVCLVYLLLSLLNIFLTIAVWSVAYKNPAYAPAIPFRDFISYFIVMLLVSQLVNSYASGEISEEHIKRGQLSVFLLKPFPYLLQEWILEIPWRLLAFIMTLPAVVMMLIYYRESYVFNLSVSLGIFGILIGAYALSYLIQVCFALLTFWLDDTHGVLNVLEILTLLFSGIGIPIFFYPPLLKNIGQFFPFQYTLFFPVTLILNRLTQNELLFSLIMFFGWILLLFFVASYLWKKGLRKYTGEGI